MIQGNKVVAFLPTSLRASQAHSSILLQILRTRIPNPILLDRKQAITLRQTGAIIDLTDPRLPPALLETQPRGRSVRDDVPSNRLLRVRIEHGAGSAVDLSDDLVRDDDRDAELVREALEGAHELREVCLPGGELAAAGEVGAVEGGGGVDDEEGEAGFAHHVRGLVEELELMVGIVSAGVGDIVQHLLARQAVSVRYG